MKKKEALDYIKLHIGYIPYSMIFETFNDEDEIPQRLIDICIKGYEPESNFMICSAELAEELKKIL